MGKLVLSHVKMMSSISSIKLVRNKSLVDIIVEVHHFDAVAPARERGLKCSPLLERLWPYGSLPRGSVD